ncbi:lysosomal Pro-X carboxypeptidase-like protein [Corchorus olitorius]|uniref:Lysosomal Pro-X carboxypeptidase-like protein n=1 Tax=Corchorus olitorius TaxID=93759 RepID=A0A1R3HZX2_9ROSI|nr:lysosomal Pro-X carboxypeptidase-like protein [Corchorus olitorius]
MVEKLMLASNVSVAQTIRLIYFLQTRFQRLSRNVCECEAIASLMTQSNRQPHLLPPKVVRGWYTTIVNCTEGA